LTAALLTNENIIGAGARDALLKALNE